MRLAAVAGGVLATAIGGAWAGDALACGGCFAPPRPTGMEQVVTDHRMAMAIHANESILWDQIRYSGSPSEFSWVLPVTPGTVIEEASSEFFDRLDADTAARWTGPQVPQCRNGGTFFAGASAAADAGFSADSGVTVLHQATVGPYDTVTLQSSNANALTDWLTSNGYTIPTTIQPVISYYVAHQMDFIALKLQPGQGVQAMQPVRVRYPSAVTVLPLRMVAAGVSDSVGITLWVIGYGRYDAMNFGNATIDPNQLVWNWDTNSANYDQVFANTLQQTANGRSWITEWAEPASVLSGAFPSVQNYVADADVGDSGSASPIDDWVLATQNNAAGMWITRMRTNLASNNLDSDLELGATENTAISGVYTINRSTGEPPSGQCSGGTNLNGGGGNSVTCDAGPVRGTGRGALAAFGLALLAWLGSGSLRRRAR